MAVRMAALKRSTHNKCREKETPLHYEGECQLSQPLWSMVWRFLKNREIESPYKPAIPLLGINSEETRIERLACTPVFNAELFTIARTWKKPGCSSIE